MIVIVGGNRTGNQKNPTVYKIDYTSVDEKPEALFMCLKILVGERGFEPPTPWSRTRFKLLLKLVEFYCLQLIGAEPVAVCSLKSVEARWIWLLSQPQNRLQTESEITFD